MSRAILGLILDIIFLKVNIETTCLMKIDSLLDILN